MSSFTTVALTGDRVLVKGTDRFGTAGQTVLEGFAWSQVKRHKAFKSAEATFDSAVEDFFAPLMAAADQLEESLAVKQPDPDTYVVLDEGVEASPGKDREVIHLDPDSVVLRLIEAGQTDRLVWVMDRLEVMVVEESTIEDEIDMAYASDHGVADDSPTELNDDEVLAAADTFDNEG